MLQLRVHIESPVTGKGRENDETRVREFRSYCSHGVDAAHVSKTFVQQRVVVIIQNTPAIPACTEPCHCSGAMKEEITSRSKTREIYLHGIPAEAQAGRKS